ncbi:alpha/beta fold hydrolase [Rhabdothermincola sediminis]|uniref:alpha/beta fold hydrolase n=1 Tax=Rhabdothermincola sediminis TaxID=2751370 RepID=UPI001AA095B0|nr:alpha/beta hydrolase [Rhabdothermincola sediminis]
MIDPRQRDASGEPAQPPGLPVPLGRRVELPGRGTTFVREVPGPPGAPTLVLLHGWMASGGINWYRVFEPAGERFRVLAPDLRGHARGLRSSRRFRLSDCADDVAALLEQLGVRSAVFAGYSMGGPVAQLIWKRHRGLVDGLVLCATSHSFVPGIRERMIFSSLMAAAAGTTRIGGLMTALPASLVKQWVPTQQAKLAFSIPHASIHRIEDGHVACASPGFAGALLAACEDVRTAAVPAGT